MNIYFDCEFTGLHKNTELISIGFISDDNKTFYAEFIDYPPEQINDWLEKNVIHNLYLDVNKDYIETYSTDNWLIKGTKENIKIKLLEWLKQFDNINFWSDVLAYDWVLLNDLISDYSKGYPVLPDNVYYIPFDIATSFKDNNIVPDINREEFVKDKITNIEIKKHNSLYDAKIIKFCYEKIYNKTD